MRSLWHSLILWRIRPLRAAPADVRAWFAGANWRAPVPRMLLALFALCAWLALLVTQFILAAVLAFWIFWESPPWWTWDEPAYALDSVVTEINLSSYWLTVGLLLVAAALATVEVLGACLAIRRLAIRRVLRRRDRCVYCGHGLAGTPLAPDDQSVRCPECGRVTSVVAAWSELDRSAMERPVFRPAQSLAPAFWTRRRIKLAAKLAATAALLVALGYGGWWGVREIGIRRQAALARSERPGSDAINELIRSRLPAHDPALPLSGDIVARMNAAAGQVRQGFIAAHQAEVDTLGAYVPDPALITFSSWLNDDEDPDVIRGRQLSVLLLDQIRAAGVFDIMDELPHASTRLERTYSAPDEESAAPPPFSPYRQALRLCQARMRRAHDAGDVADFAAAQVAAIALAHTVRSGPFLIDWLVAQAHGNVVLSAAKITLLQRPGEPWLDVLEQAALSLDPEPLAPALELERLGLRDKLAWYFSEPSRVRKGQKAPELRDEFGVGMTFFGAEDFQADRLGSYAENRDALDAYFANLILHANADSWQRGQLPVLPAGSEYLILNVQIGAMNQTLRSVDRDVLRHRALLVLLALERYRLRHGDYPAALADLPAGSPAAALLDPFSGKAFGYRRIDAAADRLGRGYLLWSVGFDGVDNDGEHTERGWDEALRPAGAGKDMILNDPRW